jgi:branched-chain amino acid transport system permease protein
VAEILHSELGAKLPGIQGVIYGAAVVTIILAAPEGLFWKVRDKFFKAGLAGDAAAVAVGPAAAGPQRRPPAQTGEVILEARGLSKNFGGLKAVDDVGFQVRKGMILGIIGPNGAGKTTAFNLLNGFLAPSAGDVLLDGRSVLGMKPHQVCELGVGRTFQIMRPFMRMSVADNVVVGAYVRAGTDAEARRLADAAIARVGLSAIAQRVASQLTSKELRLMELARALAGQPRLLLLDETLAGLGQAEAEEVLAVLRGLAAEGKTIVIIEHTMHLMVRLVDRFLVLDHGRVLAEGGPEEIIKNSSVVEAYLGKKWSAK